MSVPPSPEVRALLVLHLVPGLGPMRTAALLERFGSAAAVLEATPEEMCEVPLLGTKLAAEVRDGVRRADVEKELQLLERHGVHLVALGTPEYPEALATIPDPSHILYVRGTLEARDAKAVAIVGSRQCTTYGRRIAERLAGGLARAGYTIVSGLARGIDGVAHRAALQAGGRTIAVLANGLSRIYPPEHRGLADEVAAAGAVLSESAMGIGPLAPLFPARNRIISGLAQAVILVEAAERSGALITARHAAEQGRTAFAVPGPVDSEASGGTNRLIRDGAILCRGVEDVLEELEGVSARTQQQAPLPAAPPPGLDATQQRIWEFLGGPPRYLDEMAQQLELSVPQLSGTLLTLEMKKVVRRLPGNRYERS
jgi:DNA processing protein